MHIWSTLQSAPDKRALQFPSDVTRAMLSAACGSEHGGGGLQLPNLFQHHPPSQSLFAIMT
jgi:hypothetical protein